MIKYLRKPVAAKMIDLTTWCDSCDHVFDELADAVAYATEDDSFGPVVRAMLCACCAAEADKPEHHLTCEWCHKTDGTVNTRKSCDSADWYLICLDCHRTKNRWEGD